MLQQIGVLIVSFLVTNWIYSEILLFVPQVEPYTKKIVRVARIPTHDEWPAIADSGEAARLSRQVHQFLGVNHFSKRSFFGLRGDRSKRSYPPELPYKDLFEPVGGIPNFKSGSAIFDPPGYLYWILFDYIPL